MRSCFYSCFFVLFFASCQHWQRISVFTTETSLRARQECDLALLDVPLPNNAHCRLIPAHQQPAVADDNKDEVSLPCQVIVECSTDLAPREIVDFYMTNLEHLGWQEFACSDTVLCLVFEKPGAVCVIYGDYHVAPEKVVGNSSRSGRRIKKTIFKIFRSEKYS